MVYECIVSAMWMDKLIYVAISIIDDVKEEFSLRLIKRLMKVLKQWVRKQQRIGLSRYQAQTTLKGHQISESK